MATSNYNLPQWKKTSADSKVAYGKVKLVEDSEGNGVIVSLGVFNG